MAQRKTRKTKKKAKKGERAGRGKQKQTQRIIINLGEELAKRGGGEGVNPLSRSTRRGLCMTRRLMTQEALNRNQMIQPRSLTVCPL
jgi:hypothetical protein